MTVQAYDPEATRVAKGIFGNHVTFATKNYDALKGADWPGDSSRNGASFGVPISRKCGS